MAGALEAKSKAETARHVAQWATDELGFRKKTTLVTARGEEKIAASDIEPLLQGELAKVLDLASSHLVSLQNAADSRRRLAAYCAQSHIDKDAQSLEHVSLRRNLVDLRAKEHAILADIKGVELENQAAIQAINGVAAKRRAAECRIRELRLQILKKQLMAENLRRLTSRMRVFAHEMDAGADATQAPGILPEASAAILAATGEHGSDITKSSPSDLLASLTAHLQSSALEHSEASTAIQHINGDDESEQPQVLIAGVVCCLKDLHDQHLKTQESIQAARTQLGLRRAALTNKIEEMAGQLNLSAAANGNIVDDYKPLILQATLRNAGAQINNKVDSLVPELKPAGKYSGAEEGHDSKAADIARTIGQIQQLTSTIQHTAIEVKNIADSEVAAVLDRLLPALRYIDLRDLWGSISLTGLQRINMELSNGEKESRPMDKLVARGCHFDADRDGRLCEATSEATGYSDQAFEVIIGHLGEKVVNGLWVAHMMGAADGELETSRSKVEQIVSNGQDKAAAVEPLEAAVDKLRSYAQKQRAAAGAAMSEWAATSGVVDSLQLAKESVDTEETIARLSDTSGRLFTDLFAPWYQREGTTHAEYLKQLKIVRASDKQADAE